MNKLIPLMQREWLQYRFGWALMLVIPLALAILGTVFGQVEIGQDEATRAGAVLPAMLAMASIAGTTVVLFAIAWMMSLIIVSGVARRDHGDRSVEFWLSLPATHSASIAAPLIVHLLLVPAAALAAGVVGGWIISIALVTRVVGIGAWLALPWPDMLIGSFTVVARMLAGLPLATLWLAPLIMLTVLAAAWFRRWGWAILAVVFFIAGPLLDKVFGQPLLARASLGWIQHAGRALVNATESMTMANPNEGLEALRNLPGWALRDFGHAVRDLASPLLFGGVLLAAGCFALLVVWRQRGAGAAGG